MRIGDLIHSERAIGKPIEKDFGSSLISLRNGLMLVWTSMMGERSMRIQRPVKPAQAVHDCAERRFERQ